MLSTPQLRSQPQEGKKMQHNVNKQDTPMAIEKINLSDCVELPYNPRKILRPGDAEYQQLARSCAEFGFLEPIVVNIRTGRVVRGNQRVKVMKKKGITRTEV